MNYYERHIGDYLKDTAHLSLLEHGVYGRLLDVYYTREGPIPVAQVERLVGARSKDERAALASVLDEFFTVADDSLSHPRCDREIERYQDKQRKAKASADARWQHTERNAKAMRTHSEGNAPSLQSPVSSPQSPVCESTHMSDEFREAMKSRPELNPETVWAGFVDHYPTERRTLTKWRNWIAREKIIKGVPLASDPDSRASVESLAKARGMRPWDELEQWDVYKTRVKETT